MQRTGKDADTGKDWRQEGKGMIEDEMVGWHHWCNIHEFEQARGVGDGQGSLVCCSPGGCKESDMTEGLNWTNYWPIEIFYFSMCFWNLIYYIQIIQFVGVQLFTIPYYTPFYFYKIYSIIPSFISDFSYLGILSFIPLSVSLKDYQFCWPFQRTNSWLCRCSLFLLYSVLFIPPLVCIISFLW